MQGFGIMINTSIQRFDQAKWFGYKAKWFVIDKSTDFQTICQINKYQTRVSPNHVYGVYGYIGYAYHRYKGLSMSSLYRRILAASQYMRRGGGRAGYIRDTKPYLLAIYTNHSIGTYMA